jgi:hypothetical protein
MATFLITSTKGTVQTGMDTFQAAAGVTSTFQVVGNTSTSRAAGDGSIVEPIGGAGTIQADPVAAPQAAAAAPEKAPSSNLSDEEFVLVASAASVKIPFVPLKSNGRTSADASRLYKAYNEPPVALSRAAGADEGEAIQTHRMLLAKRSPPLIAAITVAFVFILFGCDGFWALTAVVFLLSLVSFHMNKVRELYSEK